MNSYKTYENKNHAMVPGFNSNSQLAKISTPDYTSSPKRNREENQKSNNEKLLIYGANHLGSSVSTIAPKNFRGQGGLL